MLHTENLSKDMGEFVLRNVTLDVSPGEYLVIIGPTGAGKTILLETIAGFYPPDSGKIIMDGRDITNFAPKDRNICMVYQDYMLFPYLNIEKNIGFGLRQLRHPSHDIRKATEGIASLLGITHLLSRRPDTLSGGEQQRVAIARALVIKPRILLLDEPLSALDAITHKKMRNELARIPMLTGVSVIHITHHAEDLISLGHRTAVMDNGAIVQIGSPDEIFQNPKTPFVAAFTGMENLFSGIAMDSHEGKVIRIGQVKIHVITPYTGPVQCGIRPDALIFSREPLKSSARNVLMATVTKIRRMGSIAWVVIDCGIFLTGVLTIQSLYELRIDEGDTIFIAFKASAVMVFPEETQKK